MDGISLADSTVLDLLGGPDLVRAALKKDGSFTRHSRVANDRELAALFTYLEEKMGELAVAILQGDARAYPYKKANGQRACSLCSFMPLCRFDVSVEGNRYRNVFSAAHGEILQAAMARRQGGEHDEVE